MFYEMHLAAIQGVFLLQKSSSARHVQVLYCCELYVIINYLICVRTNKNGE